ncbi:MAG: phenylalanine--tRNA ligase beta subunit-related protein [Pyramidobacter sp.]|nr:phenylalanine--tRNA ligase beta subunit-related protein [Pyramidobacter sp.]
MKKFTVDAKVFDVFPDYCLGVVAAEGIDNSKANAKIDALLEEQIADFVRKYQSENVREITNVKAFRDAFAALGMNPNKFMCSIEALAKRVQKSAALPLINPIVNLGNALSLKYILPVGAHDIGKLGADMEVRFSAEQDHFLPMGETQEENMPQGELVYVSGGTVKTRRWIWRQSDDGKITSETSRVFFPIDGFENLNAEHVLNARDELASVLQEEYGCRVRIGYVNRKENSFDLE